MKLVKRNGGEYVLAIDPGGNTGCAWLIDGEFGSCVVPGGRTAFVPYFLRSCGMRTPDQIVCEDFIITSATARKTAQPDPWRIIGYLEGWALTSGVPFKLQTPSQAKGFSGTPMYAKLKRLGWYRTGHGGHDNDAAAHLLLYLVANRLLDDRRMSLLLPASDS